MVWETLQSFLWKLQAKLFPHKKLRFLHAVPKCLDAHGIRFTTLTLQFFDALLDEAHALLQDGDLALGVLHALEKAADIPLGSIASATKSRTSH